MYSEILSKSIDKQPKEYSKVQVEHIKQQQQIMII